MPVGNSDTVHIGTKGTGTSTPFARKGSTVADPSNVFLIVEIDSEHGFSTQGYGRGAANSYLQTHPTGNGSQTTQPNCKNYTANLHNSGKVNYLHVDGHVDNLDPLSDQVLGTGSDTQARGRWSIDPED